MPLAQANIIRFEDLRSIAYTSISGSYAGVGSTFADPIRILKITNTTDADVIISFDGINDKDIVPATSGEVYDFCANKSDSGGLLEQSVGTRVYVKTSGSPTKGSVYVTVIYASDV